MRFRKEADAVFGQMWRGQDAGAVLCQVRCGEVRRGQEVCALRRKVWRREVNPNCFSGVIGVAAQ
jgi:hypothetical protein